MLAAALTAIPSFQVVLRRKNHQALLVKVKIFGR